MAHTAPIVLVIRVKVFDGYSISSSRVQDKVKELVKEVNEKLEHRLEEERVSVPLTSKKFSNFTCYIAMSSIPD